MSFFLLAGDFCENNGHPSYCSCRREALGESCHYCQHNHCRFQGLTQQFVCLSCNRYWKSRLSKDQRRQWLDDYATPYPTIKSRCMQCGSDGKRVSHVLRVPEKTDKKGWILLAKILDTSIFANYPKDSIGFHWYQGGGIGCTLHQPDSIRKQMWVPTHAYEYDGWLEAFKKKLDTSEFMVGVTEQH